MIRTAILIDGGFYNKRANYLFGYKSAKDRAYELVTYCMRHLEAEKQGKNTQEKTLYRIFYYDCMPSERTIMHPFSRRLIQ